MVVIAQKNSDSANLFLFSILYFSFLQKRRRFVRELNGK